MANLSMTYGTLPSVEQISSNFPSDGYEIECHQNTDDFYALQAAINQGIDSHLQAVFFNQYRGSYDKTGLRIKDAQSMHVLLRRLIESGDETALYLASSICQTLGIEWI